jgi:carbonic anhydrase/acetyltransferase-like protein (isoleucine patch superfamily)
MTGPYKNYLPDIAPDVFLMDTSVVIGRVTLKSGASVWAHAVLRGDISTITIGEESNIQDNCVVHITENIPVTVGRRVTVGHGAILHSCTIEDNCLIGMGSIILDRALIRENSIVGAGSLVPPGKEYPPNSLILGSPAKAVRTLSSEEVAGITENAAHYVGYSREYRTRIDETDS